MNQPVPNVTDADVARIARRDFRPDQFDAVMAVLSEYGTEEWQRGMDRVRLAVLKLADGNLDSLHRQIEIAKCDYRDVLASAEYPEYMTAIRPGADLSDELVQDVMKRDWLQYQNWLTRTAAGPGGKGSIKTD